MKIIASGALFIAYVAISCFGLYLMKAASSWTSVAFAAGAVLYVSGAATWLVILRLYPLSVAFPIASGALMIGTTLIGFFFLKEPLSAQHLAGIVLIMVGIAMLAIKLDVA